MTPFEQWNGNLLRRLKSPEKRGKIDVKSDEKFSLEFKEDNSILCRNCGNRITTLDHIIAVHGQHTHTFTNPAGITYRIGCFSRAEGCLKYGEPTLEFTWFSGFGWNIAFCARCSSHLGWHYQSSGDQFFGLILTQLVENIKTH
jgi:hypothetical protein